MAITIIRSSPSQSHKLVMWPCETNTRMIPSRFPTWSDTWLYSTETMTLRWIKGATKVKNGIIVTLKRLKTWSFFFLIQNRFPTFIKRSNFPRSTFHILRFNFRGLLWSLSLKYGGCSVVQKSPLDEKCDSYLAMTLRHLWAFLWEESVEPRKLLFDIQGDGNKLNTKSSVGGRQHTLRQLKLNYFDFHRPRWVKSLFVFDVVWLLVW